MPARPMTARAQRRVEPFRQFRHALQGSPDRLRQHAWRQAGGQRIDRLDRFDLLCLLRHHDIVRVRHLRPAAVVIDRAADDALGPDRQQALQLIASGAEIDQRQGAGAVRAMHPVGAAAETGLVTLDPDLQRDDGVGPVAWVELADRRRGTAIDNTRWKMPQQIDDEGAGGALDQAPELRPDPGQDRNRRKQPVEKGGTHLLKII